MTLIEELDAHKGGLILLKNQLYWYDGRGWGPVHDRVCLLLNTAAGAAGEHHHAAATATARLSGSGATIELLVDGAPRWVWVAQADVELL